MNDAILPDSVSSIVVETARLRTHCLKKGSDGGTPVILVHGNLSTSLLWDETLASFPDDYLVYAIDMRGFGSSEHKPIDATRGMGDFADDLRAFVEAVGLEGPLHLAGHSTGGGVIMQYAMNYPGEVASLTLAASVSPYGFGGTRDVNGTPSPPDFAGTGAGIINPDLMANLLAGDTTADNDFTLRSVMRAFYWRPDYQVPQDREDAFVDHILEGAYGDKNFPGDMTTSENWPAVGPGTFGVNNALSGKYCNLSSIVDIEPKPPILWLHGADDLVVSDTSMFDFGFLGQLGAVPGWPGVEAFPPQPMKQQIRAILGRYEANGGSIQEVEIADSGHSSFIDQPETFQKLFFGFLAKQ